MLKKISDGLTKVWKSDRCHEPFYSGGKVCEESFNGLQDNLTCIKTALNILNATYLD